MIKQLVNIVVAIPLFALLLGSLLLAGCTTRHQTMATGPIAVGGFVQAWQEPLNLRNNSITHLYLTDSALYVYTARNLVYCLSPSGGQILWIQQIALPGDVLSPPVQIKGTTVIAVSSTIWVLGPDGQVDRKINVGNSVSSPMAAMGEVVYCGVGISTGGRLAKIDLTVPYNHTRWELFTAGRGVLATPVVYQASIYAGSEDGNVYAVYQDRTAAWPLDGSMFHTDGPIVAGLKADDFGVYVASMDSKLYCLDRATGRLKWQYYSGHPLDKSPVPTADSVYQAITGVGVAAIDKVAGPPVRTPRWLVRGAQRFLGEDSEFVYLRTKDNGIIGVEKTTGEPKLHSTRTDLIAFTTNPNGSTLFAATADGLVLGINPVNTPGTVGTVVQNSTVFERVASAR